MKAVLERRGWFYLHINGTMHYKTELGDIWEDMFNSAFVRHIWPVDPTNRETGWNLFVESLALGAIAEDVHSLAEKGNFDNDDAGEYAERIGIDLAPEGSHWLATRKDFWGKNKSPYGEGPTALDAMANLCKALGFKASKDYPTSFRALLTTRIDA
jgi:hypothetical protein